MPDANFLNGSNGLIAIDKVGNQVLFLDPGSYETVLTLDGFAPRVHEVLIAPDRATAYVPIYGDGIHGKNPHPGHLVALFDLPMAAEFCALNILALVSSFAHANTRCDPACPRSQ